MAVMALAPDQEIVAALRNGDEAAFAALLDAYHASMVRVAMLYTGDRALAEDVTQETWVAVVKGIGSFEGRSALKTWIFTILTNRAKTRSQRERRSLPFSALLSADEEAEEFEPAVAPSAFAEDGWWRDETHPQAWRESPEAAFSSAEVSALLKQAIEALPPNQRQVITLRDVEGWTSDEVCNVLGVSESNQRVLLHRARAKVRLALDEYFNE
jgi:RNA polymerase sigma-70 factor (ECF subfamily)